MGYWFGERPSDLATSARRVAGDILMLQLGSVNAYLVGRRGGEIALVDTGLIHCADFIQETVERHFGRDARPHAIILTHGHFDHVGTVITLANRWDVRVFCHPLEMPYLTGQREYLAPDPSAEDGVVPLSINLGTRVAPLPEDGSVPAMEGWRWIHTPGHADGHVALFRERDRTLIAGDALDTVTPEFITVDWLEAHRSAAHLKELNPSLVLPSHGDPLTGEELHSRLDMLAQQFTDITAIDQARFVEGP